MNLKTFVTEYTDLKEEAVKTNLLWMLQEAIDRIETGDGEYALQLMADGILDKWVDIEDDDGFGTEGLISE